MTIKLMNQEVKLNEWVLDGDMARMIALIEAGWCRRCVWIGRHGCIHAVDGRYEIRDARKIVRAAKKTPIVDGSGLKNTLERRVIIFAETTNLLDNKK